MWWEKEKKTLSDAVAPAPLAPQAPLRPPVKAPSETPKMETPMPETMRREINTGFTAQGQALIGRSLVIKGELSANEDLLIEGQFDGTVNLQEHCLTIGTNGKVKAQINARQVVIQGTVNGNINASEKIEVRKSGSVMGDLVSASVAIEEGAYFKGSIDINRDGESAAPRALTARSLAESGS